MIINTKYFGEIEIDESKKITFAKGLPAFEEIKEYVLIDLPDNPVFHCLQSTKQSEVAFLVIQPWDFFHDYDIDIPQEDLEELEINKKEQVLIYNILTIPKDINNMTANLLGPIVINIENLKGKQVILPQEDYHTKHPLIEIKEEV